MLCFSCEVKTMFTEKMIKDIIKQYDYKLLGEILVEDGEYRELLSYVIKVIDKIVNKHVKFKGLNGDLVFALGMTQVTIRNYNGSFWPDIEKAVGIHILAPYQREIGNLFIKTIREHNLFELRITGNMQFAEIIKAHAYVTNNYMDGWFDFWDAYYEYSLYRQLSDFGDYDVQALREYMKASLKDNSDQITEINNLNGVKTKKSYRLLRSTRHVLAECDSTAAKELMEITLKMIDDYYYDFKLPDFQKGRFEKEFIKRCEKKQDQNYSGRRKPIDRKLLSHIPYIYIYDSKAYLIIPRQRFRKKEIDRNAVCNVCFGNTKQSINLTLTESFGMYASAQKSIDIPDVFDYIEVTITAKDKTVYNKSLYRIFDSKMHSIPSLKIDAENMLIIKKGVPFSTVDKHDCLEYDPKRNTEWDTAFVNVTESTIINIGGKNIFASGKITRDPFFEKLRHDIVLYDTDNNKLKTTVSHPTIFLSVDKNKIAGTMLYINDKRFDGDSIIKHSKIEDNESVSENEVLLNIDVNNLVETKDDIYYIYADIPGEGRKKVCKYIILNELQCEFDKMYYTYDIEAVLSVKSSFMVYNLDDRVESDHIKNTHKFKTMIGSGISELELFIEMSETIHFKMAIPVLGWGTTDEDVFISKDELWYNDMQNTAFFNLPEFEAPSLCLSNEKNISCRLERIHDCMYKANLNNIRDYIVNQSTRLKEKLIVQSRNHRNIDIIRIVRRVYKDPEFYLIEKDQNGNFVIDIEKIHGKADLYINVENTDNNVEVIKDQKLNEGLNYLKGLSEYDLYKIKPYMLEEGLFEDERTELQFICPIGYYDRWELTGWRLRVRSVKTWECNRLVLNCKYYYDVYQHIVGRIYAGRLYAAYKNADNTYTNVTISDMVCMSVNFTNKGWCGCSLSVYEDDIYNGKELYYNTQTNELVNSYCLSEDELYDKKYIQLWNDSTEFRLSIYRKISKGR